VLNLHFFFILLFGPPAYHTKTISLEGESPALSAKRVHLHLGPFNFLNDFVTVDAVFLRPVITDTTVSPIQISLIAKSHKGSRIETIYGDDLRKLDVDFSSGTSYSRRVRLFSRAIVDFATLDLDVLIKFLDPDQALTGLFAVTYANTAHALLELIVRLLVFFVGLIVLVYLLPMDKSKTAAPFQLRVLTVLILLAVLASNPFIILSYFTSSIVLPMVDATLAITLITGAAAGAVLILESARKTAEQLNENWLLTQAAPFIMTGLLFLITALRPNLKGTAIQVLTYMRTAGSVVCFLRAVIALLAYRPEVSIEKLILGGLMSVTFSVCILSEVFCFVEPLISSAHEVQIFTYAAVSTFILFIVKFYWPVDAKRLENEETPVGDQKIEPLT
jgi:hypothetical protein